jgi:hypothetical protein
MKSLIEVINEAKISEDIFADLLNARSEREYVKELSKLVNFFKKKFRVDTTDTKLPSDYKGNYFVAFDPTWNQMIYGDYNDGYVIKWDNKKNEVSHRYVGVATFFSEPLDIYDATYLLEDVLYDLKFKAENTPFK